MLGMGLVQFLIPASLWNEPLATSALWSLEAYYDTIMDEPQLSLHNLFC